MTAGLFPKPYADFVARLRVPSGFLLAAAFAWFAQPSVRSLIYGLPISVAGLALRAWAAGHLAKNQRLATSGPFTVTASGATLSASPASLVAGGTVTATWSGIPAPTSTDFIALYVPGTSDQAYLAWIYLSCSKSPGAPAAAGSCPFTIPSGLAPGRYELRLYANNTYTRLATSNPFDVTP